MEIIMSLTAKQKARQLLEKVNNGVISDLLWQVASEYAKSDLKRKTFIIVDELINSYSQFTGMHDQDFFDAECYYWKNVRNEITIF